MFNLDEHCEWIPWTYTVALLNFAFVKVNHPKERMQHCNSWFFEQSKHSKGFKKMAIYFIF